MTQNQIAWFKASEEARHNYAMEKETARSNLENERNARNILAETNRNNVVVSNETRRTNMAREMLTAQQQAELRRHNAMNESITLLANQNTVAQQRYQTDKTYSLGLSQLGETVRTHQANEGIAAQSYRASVREQQRHNRADESIRRYSNVTQRNLSTAQAVNYIASANLSRANTARVVYITPYEMESYKYGNELTQQRTRLTGTQADLYPLEVESQLLGNTAKSIGVIYKGGK